MQSKAIVAPLLALMVSMAPALAQEATDAETTTEDAAAAPEAPVGEDPTNEPAPGETYLAEEHGDWELRCVAVQEGAEPCQLYQVLTDGNGGSVAEIVVFPLPDRGEAIAGALITTPLETLLTEQIAVAVDSGEGRLYPFSFCTEQGCVARIGLTNEDLDKFRKGAEARIRIVPARAPDQTVILSASLRGFTAGYAAVSERASN